jgi:hypothetical protein
VDNVRLAVEDNARKGWITDVVVVDYADLLGDPPGYHKENRDKINANWKAMSDLRLDKNLLLLTATQANAESYGKRTMGKKSFSDDKRKNAHVTAMITINKVDEEEERGVYRLDWLFRRNEAKAPQVHVAGCLALANPAMVSTFGKREGGDD